MNDDKYAYQVMAECAGDFERFNEMVFPNPDPLMPSIHPGQAEFMADATKKFDMLCPGNSWGKTEFLTRSHVFWNTFKDGMHLPAHWPIEKQAKRRRYAEYRTLNCSFDYDHADLVFERIIGYRNEIKFINWLVETVRRREREIVFRSGGILKIGSLEHKGKLIEGDRYYKISVDEVGWVQDFKKIRDDVLVPRCIVPYSDMGGQIYLFGTPKPVTDPEVFIMFESGKIGHPDIYAREGSTYENIFLTEMQIEKLKNLYKDSPTALRQVLYGEFVQAGGMVFRGDAIRRMVWPELKHPAPYIDGHIYITCWDYARRQDHTVGSTLDVTRKPYKMVNFIRVPKADAEWPYIYKVGMDEAERYHVRAFVMDKSGMGGDIIESQLSDLGLPIVGIDFGGQGGTKKINIVQALVDALDEPVHLYEEDAKQYAYHLDRDELEKGNLVVKGAIKTPAIDQLIKEMSYYAWDDKKLETDCIMSLAMGLYYMNENYAPPPCGDDVMAELIRR